MEATLVGKAGNYVLDGASQDVTVMWQTRGKGRAIVKGVPGEVLVISWISLRNKTKKLKNEVLHSNMKSADEKNFVVEHVFNVFFKLKKATFSHKY